VDAEANLRGVDGRDEIDVAFTLDDVHYVLEAKWHARPQAADGARKLGDDVRQRLRGTRGLILSMSGYTKHAGAAVERGQQPDVVLLDRLHFEALLSGLMTPSEMLAAIYRRLSRTGGVYVPAADLITTGAVPTPPHLKAAKVDNVPWEVVLETTSGASADAVLIAESPWPAVSGIGAAHRRGHVWITCAEGVVDVAAATGRSSWVFSGEGCRGTPIAGSDGSCVLLRDYAVIRWHAGSIAILGGAFTGRTELLAGPDGTIWVFDHTGHMHDRLVTLTRLDAQLGSHSEWTIESDPAPWTAAWLGEGRRFYLAGGGYSAAVDLDVSPVVDREHWRVSPQPGPQAPLVENARNIVAASYEDRVRGSVYRIDPRDGSNTKLVTLAVNSVQGMTGARDTAYVLADVRGNDAAPRPVLIRLGLT
jgi:hypothetical protein